MDRPLTWLNFAPARRRYAVLAMDLLYARARRIAMYSMTGQDKRDGVLAGAGG